MSYKIKKLKNAKMEIQLTIRKEEIAEQYKKALKQEQKKAVIPGFRKGHIPDDIFMDRFGLSIYYSLVESIITAKFNDIIKKENIYPYTEMTFDGPNIEFDKDIEITSKFFLYPSVELPDISTIEIKGFKTEIKPEHIDNELKELQNHFTEISIVEDAEILGKTHIGEFDMTKIGEDNKTQKGVDINLAVKDEFGLIRQIIGMKKGEERVIKVKYPKDFDQKELAGTEIEYKMVLRNIKKETIPAIDDELAKDLGEYDSLEDLKKYINVRLEQLAREKIDKLNYLIAMKEIQKHSHFDIPDILKERLYNDYVENFKAHLKQEETEIKDYFAENMDEKEIYNKFRKDSILLIKNELIKQKIKFIEKIKIDENDLWDHIKMLYPKNQDKDIERIIKKNKKQFIEDLEEKKIIDIILDKIKISKIETIPFEDIDKKIHKVMEA